MCSDSDRWYHYTNQQFSCIHKSNCTSYAFDNTVAADAFGMFRLSAGSRSQYKHWRVVYGRRSTILSAMNWLVLVCLGVAIAIVKWAQVLLVFWGQGYAQGLSHPACDPNHVSIRVKQGGPAAREGLPLHNFDNHVFRNVLGAEPCFSSCFNVSPTTNCQFIMWSRCWVKTGFCSNTSSKTVPNDLFVSFFGLKDDWTTVLLGIILLG